MTSFAFYALKENKRKILSWLCVISMIFNMLPVTAFATEAEEAYAPPTEIAQEAASDDVKEDASAGYNKISEDIYVQVANDGSVTMTTTEWASLTGNSVDGYTMKVFNNASVAFPSTGASDRPWIFIGAVLILIAAAVALTRRKRRYEGN